MHIARAKALLFSADFCTCAPVCIACADQAVTGCQNGSCSE